MAGHTPWQQVRAARFTPEQAERLDREIAKLKDWDEIKAEAAPETIARAARKTEAMLAELELTENREARNEEEDA